MIGGMEGDAGECPAVLVCIHSKRRHHQNTRFVNLLTMKLTSHLIKLIIPTVYDWVCDL